MPSLTDLRQVLDENRPNCPHCQQPMNAPSADSPGRWYPGGRLDARYTCGNRQCNAQMSTVTLYPGRRDPAPTDADPQHTSNGGTMSTNTSTGSGTATGDVHDVETCDNQLDALLDDLTTIDTALDVIDNSIGDAGAATERIEAWLRSKNVDDTTVGGMSQALEMLSPDRIKSLMDAIAAAKAGVQATKDGLGPLREAAGMLNGADGSVLNGR